MICNYTGTTLHHAPERCAYDGKPHRIVMGQCEGCTCPNPYYEEKTDLRNMAAGAARAAAKPAAAPLTPNSFGGVSETAADETGAKND